jgi:beta-mannosidase
MRIERLFLLISVSMYCLSSFSQTSDKSLNNLDWKFRKKGDKSWLKATVPGTVHTDLLANKIISDPYFGENEKQLQWIENEDWEYMTNFVVSAQELKNQHIELQFYGLDTYAKVYINDSLILNADNMFRTWNVEIKRYLKLGNNKIFILFESFKKKAFAESKKLAYTLPGDERIFTRKAQYQYGWDWGPRFVTCGIWKNVKLNFWNKAKIEHINYTQKFINDSLVEITMNCEVMLDQYMIDAKLDITLETPNMSEDHYLKIFSGSGLCDFDATFLIKNPKKWWCNGMGEPNMYRFKFELGNGYFKVWDSKTIEIGIRTIELIQDKDSIGKSFYFKLNGIPIFIKGANVIPPDNFLPRVTKNDYKSLVKNAVDANMNMLRVWGGGVYGDDDFYYECDKNGIMVWQDFMFACAMYPSVSTLSGTVKFEIEDQIKRLQNHPSLALWCGNNEIDEGWNNWGWQKQYHYSKKDSLEIYSNYKHFFEELLPYYIQEIDPLRSSNYWPSSASIGWGRKESLIQGDVHYWGVWWGLEPFETYNKKVGRFVSEYGFQGMPDYSTFKKIATENDLNFNSAAVKNHQKHPSGYQTIETYMKQNYKIPKNFEDYIYISQCLQADGMKTAIEAHRRAKPYCMGTLYWQLNDCWPVTSWSSVDYFNNWKAAHYMVKRSYRETIISFNKADSTIEVYCINDALKNKNGTLKIQFMDFYGNVNWSKTLNINLLSNSSQLVYSINKLDFNTSLFRTHLLSAQFTEGSQNESIQSLFYFEKPKNLVLLKPTFAVINLSLNSFSIKSDFLAKNVSLSTNPNLSDNYFDLLPGEEKIIYLSEPPKNSDFKNSLIIKSLFDVK